MLFPLPQGTAVSMDPTTLCLALLIALVAGMVKGIVGFAMPMILMSGLGTLVAPEIALAALILPTLLGNGIQAFRQGPVMALMSVKKFRRFLIIGCICLVTSAQFVLSISSDILVVGIGSVVAVASLIQILGMEIRLKRHSIVSDTVFGTIAGLLGGVSGIWGPPTVLYLLALNTEKMEQIRIQGVIYGLGAVAMTGAHMVSGVLNFETVWLSVVLTPAALIGMWIGGILVGHIRQHLFRRATLIVLLLGALNLMRLGLLA